MDSPKGSEARSFDWRFKRFSIPRSTTTDTTSSVYFTGEGDPSQYTFYREPTPPPLPPLPPALHREKTTSGTWTATGTYASTGPVLPGGQRALLVGEDDERDEGLICGLRRRIFWIALLAVVIIIIAVAVGVGVGVGAGNSKKDSSTAAAHGSSSSAATFAAATASPSSSTISSAISSASSSASTPASSTTSGPSSTSSASSPSATATLFQDDCLATNDTFYVPEDYNKRFHRICGIDFSGAGGATDIGNLLTANMTECMDSCAKVTECTGCAWGFIKGDQGPTHRCWLKKDLGKSHFADTEWCFARLV